MNKKIAYGLLFTILVVGIFFILFSLNKDITGEETEFVNAAISIVKTGHPVFYQSEQIPNQLALWHPPMYIYALSAIVKFSTSEIALRSLNAIFIFLTSILIYLFCTRILDKTKGNIVGLIASSLFIINYYVLSSSGLIDIDCFSTFFVFAFIFFTLLSYRERKVSYYFGTFIAFLFALANRYPIAILVFIVILAYFIINKETRKFSKTYFFISLCSGIVFLIVWAIYSMIIEPGTFFSFIIHNAQLGSEQFYNFKIYTLSFLLNISQLIRLFTLPVIILFLIAFFNLRKKRDNNMNIILLYTLIILLFFIFIPRPAFGYPRYFLTLSPGLFIIIASYVENKFRGLELKREYIVFGLVCFLATFIILIMFNPQPTLYRNDGLIRSTNLPDFIFNMLGILPLTLVFMFKRNMRKIALIIALTVILFSYNIYFDIKYISNDSHIRDVGDYIRAHTSNSDIILCPKAVGYYAEREFYANDFYKPPLNSLSADFFLDYIKESYRNRAMNTQFFWGKDIYGGIYYSNYTKQDANVLNAKYVVLNYKIKDRMLETKIGQYYVYRLKE